MNIRISVIIPTKNRAKVLADAFYCISKQTANPNSYEIIIVDNGSSDETKGVCEKFKSNNPHVNFRYFYDEEPGMLTGRHFGAAQSVGDILSFIDDDVELPPTWISSILEIMLKESNVMFLTGPNLPKFETFPPSWLKWFWNTTPHGGEMCSFLSLLDLGNCQIEIDPNFVWGLNFTVRKSAFLDLKGFHADCIPTEYQKYQGDGETGLTIKGKNHGMKALYHPAIMLYHQVPTTRMTYEYFDKRAYYQGVSDSFTDLRKKFGLYKISSQVDQTEKVTIITENLNRLKKRIKKSLSLINIIHAKASIKIPCEIQSLIERFNNKQHEGYEFHQQCFNSDQKVREWVLRDNYMDYKLPD